MSQSYKENEKAQQQCVNDSARPRSALKEKFLTADHQCLGLLFLLKGSGASVSATVR